MELFFIMLGVFAILLVLYLIVKDFETGIRGKVQNVIDEGKIPDMDFQPTQSIQSPDLFKKIAIDELQKKIAIWEVYDDSTNAMKSKVSLYSFSEILAVEILENGSSITQTSRKSQIGGALLGGILAGGVGAIVGGLSGKTISNDEIQSVDLKIILNDMSRPFYIINIFSKLYDNDNIPIKKGTVKYNALMGKVYHWHSILGYAIKEADEKDGSKETPIEKQVNFSLTTQLKELNELKVQGILTDDEFQQQKTKILNA